MRVEFLVKWRGFVIGDEHDMDPWLGDTLVAHGIVKELEAVVECAAEVPAENTMANPGPRKRKRAPRKRKKEGE